MTGFDPSTTNGQLVVTRRSASYWRVTVNNPPINVMGPAMVKDFQDVINTLEADDHVKVVVFDSAVDDYFLNHSDFTADLDDLTSLPAGPTGLPPWPDFLARLLGFLWRPSRSSAAARRATEASSHLHATWDSPVWKRPSSRNGKWGWGWSPAAVLWPGCRNSSAATARSRCC